MAFEKFEFNMPTEEEKQKWENAPDYEERLRQEEIESDRVKSGIQEVLTKIDAPKLRDEALQEVKEKGLFDEDASPVNIDAQRRLRLLVEERKIAESAKRLVTESLDEEEKGFAYELLNQCESNSYQLSLKHTQIARQNDMGRERYAGEQTAEAEVKALEELSAVGAIGENELSERKARLLDQLERGLRL